MREYANARYLKIALDLMTAQQLMYIADDIDQRMDKLKTSLIEETDDAICKSIKEEYMALKEIRSLFVVDLNLIG